MCSYQTIMRLLILQTKIQEVSLNRLMMLTILLKDILYVYTIYIGYIVLYIHYIYTTFTAYFFLISGCIIIQISKSGQFFNLGHILNITLKTNAGSYISFLFHLMLVPQSPRASTSMENILTLILPLASRWNSWSLNFFC